MKQILTLGFLAAAIAFPVAAQADAHGSREAAGGAFMSSYQDDPYHDPRSLHSQRNGTGQILGSPMLSENAGAKPITDSVVRQRPIGARWSVGTAPRGSR